jgi:hypothetical protein
LKFELYTTILKYSRIIIGITVFTLASSLFAGGFVFAFTGPALPAGQGGGVLQLDASGNIGFGTSLATPTGDPTNARFGKIFTVASTSDPGIALKNLTTGGHTYVWYSRPNGRLALWDETALSAGALRFFVEPNGNIGIGPVGIASSTLHVGGSIQTEAAFVGQLSPSSITGGAFQSTNYAFPSALGVGTSSIARLPTNGLYVAGNVGIGVMSPSKKLEVFGDIALSNGGKIGQGNGWGTNGNSYNATLELYNGSTGYTTLQSATQYGLLLNPAGGKVGIGTTSPSAKLHLYNGSAHIEGPSTGNISINSNVYNIQLGPLHDRSTTVGSYYSGIAFNHLLNYQGGTTFNGSPQAWIGTRLNDTAGSERDYLVFATKSGTGITGSGNDIPVERMTISPTGNVGIGITNPNQKLAITTNAQTDVINYGIDINISGAPTWQTSGIKVSNTSTGTGANSGIELNVNNGGNNFYSVYSTGSAKSYFNGSVGIGITNPAQKLSVAGVVESTTGGFKFPDGSIQLTAGGGGNSVGWSRTGTYVTLTTTTDWVAIGTSTPTQALHVQGNAYVSGNITTGGTMTTNVGASNVSAGTFGYTAGKGNYTFEAAASTNNVLKVDATNERVGIGTTAPANKLQIGALANYAGNDFTIGDGTGQFAIDQTSAITNFYSNNNFAFLSASGGNGRVGIGATSPAAKLEVYDTSTNELLRVKNTAVGTQKLVNIENYSSDAGALLIRAYSSTGGGEVFTVTPSGRAGIGNASPQGRFHVGSTGYSTVNAGYQFNMFGPVNIMQRDSAADSYIVNNAFFNSGGAWQRILASGAGRIGWNSDAAGSMDFKVAPTGTAGSTFSWVNAMSISGDGNVGIGTTNPGSLLEISSATADAAKIYLSERNATGGENGGLIFRGYYNATTNLFDAVGIKRINIEDNNAITNKQRLGFFVRNPIVDGALVERMSIRESGYVGIGTTTPAYLLHVNGTAKFENPIFVGSPGDSGHAATKGYVDSVLGSGGSGTSTASFATMYVSGTSTLAATTGKVIIGGAGPSLKLDVIGQGQLTDTLSATKYYDYNDPTYYIDPANTGTSLKFAGAVQSDGTGINYMNGQLAVGTTNPGTHRLYVSGTSWFNNQVTINGNLTMNASSSITLSGGNIGSIGKITVQTIDPLYEIDGKKYATYTSSIAGGVKEEFVGRGQLTLQNSKSETLNSKQCQNSNIKTQNSLENSDLENCLEIQNLSALPTGQAGGRQGSKLGFGGTEYQYVIDFSNIERGSDLWLWYQAVDFGKDNVQAITTPYGTTVGVGYIISGKTIKFFADEPTEFSYRLIGNRHDWKEWPTYSKDQKETPSFILKEK